MVRGDGTRTHEPLDCQCRPGCLLGRMESYCRRLDGVWFQWRWLESARVWQSGLPNGLPSLSFDDLQTLRPSLVLAAPGVRKLTASEGLLPIVEMSNFRPRGTSGTLH